MNKKISNSANRLKELMGELGISQAELCKSTGLTKSVISLYVNGKRDPRQDNLALIAETYNIDPAWLMGFDVPMKKPSSTYNRYTADLVMNALEDEPTKIVVELMDKMDKSRKDQLADFARYLLEQIEKN